jgi:hypothetical protein
MGRSYAVDSEKKFSSEVLDFSFSDDGQMVAISEISGKCSVINVLNGKRLI